VNIDKEIIIVDNSSTDGTHKIYENHAKGVTSLISPVADYSITAISLPCHAVGLASRRLTTRNAWPGIMANSSYTVRNAPFFVPTFGKSDYTGQVTRHYKYPR